MAAPRRAVGGQAARRRKRRAPLRERPISATDVLHALWRPRLRGVLLCQAGRSPSGSAGSITGAVPANDGNPHKLGTTTGAEAAREQPPWLQPLGALQPHPAQARGNTTRGGDGWRQSDRGGEASDYGGGAEGD